MIPTRGGAAKPVRHSCNNGDSALPPEFIKIVIDQVDNQAHERGLEVMDANRSIHCHQVLHGMGKIHPAQLEESNDNSTLIGKRGEKVLARQVIDVIHRLRAGCNIRLSWIISGIARIEWHQVEAARIEKTVECV